MSIVAILRGIAPDEVLSVAECLLQCGIKTLEVPLNSPQPFSSIKLLHAHFSENAVIGAGTVLSEREVDLAAEAGATLILSPNMNVQVIGRARALGLTSVPGVATPSEAFAALAAGADALKFFPADALGATSLKAWRSVLPAGVSIFAVGGIESENAASFLAAGATGLGIGSWLYRPACSIQDIRRRAEQLMRSLPDYGVGSTIATSLKPSAPSMRQ